MMPTPAGDGTDRWLALQPPVWVPFVWWASLVATIVASMVGDPGGACTVAEPCEPDLLFPLVVALAGFSAVALWWLPVSALLAGAAFGLVSAYGDPSIPGRYAGALAALVALGLAGFLTSLRSRQAAVAVEAFPTGAAQVPHRQATRPPAGGGSWWGLVPRVMGAVGLLVVVLSAALYLRGTAAEQEHLDRAYRTVGVVETGTDDDYRQVVRIQDGPLAGRQVRVTTEEDLDRGTRWPVLVDPQDKDWARLVGNPADLTYWFGWGLLGLLVLGWAVGREVRRLAVSPRRVARVGSATGVLLVAHRSGGDIVLAQERPSRPLARVPVGDAAPHRRRPAGPGVVHGRLAHGSWVAVATEDGFLRVVGPVMGWSGWAVPGAHSGAGRLVDRVAARGRRPWQRAREVGVVLVAIGGLVLGGGLAWWGLSETGPSWQAAQGRGEPGTVVVLSQSCGRGGCDHYGDWTSDDGRRRLTDVNIVGGGGDVGTRLRAYAESDDPSADAVFAPGWSGLVGSLFTVAMGLGIGGWGAGQLAAPWFLRRQRPGRHASDR
ncbi:hypothetical protein [Knoellia koreensis]|uniref:Uncharacterized protein n=1 Tax=Knoellia koreensis TaxID=2730921 RepID=A0A849HNJ8_9MICO|nr:hypothetical protein [Knoellia sp. DB2414S]NNM46187.1 hypothetical protein [Knoellia sp. DB2414S]